MEGGGAVPYQPAPPLSSVGASVTQKVPSSNAIQPRVLFVETCICGLVIGPTTGPEQRVLVPWFHPTRECTAGLDELLTEWGVRGRGLTLANPLASSLPTERPGYVSTTGAASPGSQRERVVVGEGPATHLHVEVATQERGIRCAMPGRPDEAKAATHVIRGPCRHKQSPGGSTAKEDRVSLLCPLGTSSSRSGQWAH